MTGASPNTHWLRDRLALDDKGFILTGRDLSLAVEPRSESFMASFPSASDAREQPSKSIRCRRCPRWKRQAGGFGRWRRSNFRVSGASSSLGALLERIRFVQAVVHATVAVRRLPRLTAVSYLHLTW
jgi:hypothetical protein